MNSAAAVNSVTALSGVSVDGATTRGIDYGAGESLDVYGGGQRNRPALLLWHGAGAAERHVLEPLATCVAAAGALVVVPDWRADAPDGGRAQLLASLSWTRAHAGDHGGDPTRIALGGWSRGARAAVGVATNPSCVGGFRPTVAIGVAGRYSVPADPTGTVPIEDLEGGGPAPIPVHLVCGSADQICPPACTRELAAGLDSHGWPVTVTEHDGDHSSVVWAVFDPAIGRSVPAPVAAAGPGRRTADAIIDALGLPPLAPRLR